LARRRRSQLHHALWLERAARFAKILSLGSALQPDHGMAGGGFSTVGPFEICLLLGIGLALHRGITLPPMRIVLLLGLVHMSLAQGRAAEVRR
jgi:hypothetical protein